MKHVCEFRVTPSYSRYGVLLHDSVCLTCFNTHVAAPNVATQTRLLPVERVKGEK